MQRGNQWNKNWCPIRRPSITLVFASTQTIGQCSPCSFGIRIVLLLAFDQVHLCIYSGWLMQKLFQVPRAVKFRDSFHTQIIFLCFCIAGQLLLASSLVENFFQSSTCWQCPTAIQRFHYATLAFRQKYRLVHLLYRFSVYARHIELHQTELDIGLFQNSRMLPLCSIQNCRLSWLDLTDA